MKAVNEYIDTKELVRRARKSSGLTQEVFCEEIGKRQGTVSKYEKGEHVPPGDVIIRCIRLINENDAKDIGMDDEIFGMLTKLIRLRTEKRKKEWNLLCSLVDHFSQSS